MQITDDQHKRIVTTLEMFIEDWKWRFDEQKLNTELGSQGGYSPELQGAIKLVEEIKQGS